MKIKTQLPIFQGFYNTIFEPNEDSTIEDYNDCNGTDYKFDDFKFDYDEYHNRIAKECINSVEKNLNELGFKCSIAFEKIDSPKYYNYRNDSIDIELKITKQVIKKLYSVLKENKEEFEIYIKENFTSRSGFISFYSNDVDVWLNDLDFSDNNVCEHILNFVLQINEYNVETMYYDCEGVYFLDCELLETV